MTIGSSRSLTRLAMSAAEPFSTAPSRGEQRAGRRRPAGSRCRAPARAGPRQYAFCGHQRAAHVGVVGDGDARRGLVGRLGQVGALHALLGVVEGVEVAGREGGDRLGADHHPGVLDDVEHLGDAVVHVAEQGADGRLLAAEGQLAGRGDLQAHLLLDVGDVDAVALAELAGLEVDGYFGTTKSDRPLVPGPAPSGRASTKCTTLSTMSDSAEVMKRLTPVMVPGAVGVAGPPWCGRRRRRSRRPAR